MQAMVLELGGRVEGGRGGRVRPLPADRLRARAPARAARRREQSCWMSHRDTVYEAPPGFTALASSSESPVAAIEDPERRLYGIQFHPEVVHTPYGTHILETLPAGHRRLRHGLERGLGDRRAGGPDPRAGGRRQGDLRALRRGRLLGGRAADLPRRRRPAHLRVRRPRPDAQERGQPGGRRLPRPVPGAADRGRRRGALPAPSGRRGRAGGASARSSARSSSGSSRSRPAGSTARATWCRAPSTPT